MNANSPEITHANAGQKKLFAFVRSMIGASRGREDEDHPLPPGPWDPVIRQALERINVFGPHPEPWQRLSQGNRLARTADPVFGPQPEPWKVLFASILARHPEIFDVLGGGHGLGEQVALNPQPLPPRYAFLVAVAQTLASRAELMQEISDATARKGEQHGIIIVGGYVGRFSDDFCGTGFRLKWPFPGPQPHWFVHELDAIDLVVMASQFDEAAKLSFSQDLRRSLAGASSKFAEAGLAKMGQ